MNKQPTLTPTEMKVLSLVIKGHSNQEIADGMVVSKRTVDFHLDNICHKLQVNYRVPDVRLVMQLGLIP